MAAVSQKILEDIKAIGLTGTSHISKYGHIYRFWDMDISLWRFKEIQMCSEFTI